MELPDTVGPQYKLLCGKTVLIIGVSQLDRQILWKTFRDLGLKIILVAAEDKNHGRDQVKEFIHYDYTKGTIDDDEDHADAVVDLLGDRVKQLSACFTFDEFTIHLTSLLCQKLGFLGLSPNVARIVQSKQNTNEILKTTIDDPAIDTGKYSSISFRIKEKSDIWKVSGLVFPAILKPEFGTGSWAITEVSSLEDCADKFLELQKAYGNDWKGFRYGSSMVLMEFLPGISYHVDVVIYDGALLKALPTDMGPKLPGVFADTTTCFPTCLSSHLQNELFTAAFRCCTKLELGDGVFNVEMKLTRSGFKLIEINARPGACRRCSVFKTTHCIDLNVVQAMIACGIKPSFPEVDQKYAVGCYLYRSDHGRKLSDPKVIEKIRALVAAKEILFFSGMQIRDNDDIHPKAIGHIVAVDQISVKRAKQKLINIFYDLDLVTQNFNIEMLTACFS